MPLLSRISRSRLPSAARASRMAASRLASFTSCIPETVARRAIRPIFCTVMTHIIVSWFPGPPLPARPAGIRRAGGADGPAVELPVSAAMALASDSCGLADLAQMCAVTEEDRRGLVLTAGWSGRWMTTWKVAGLKVTCPVADMGAFPAAGCEPVRHFAWATRQGHRPGLQSMAGTGRLHGFESHADQRLLPALDFLGAPEVVSQPHRMRFESASGPQEHTPDFLAVTGEGTWLLDVRPADRIGAADRGKFAASAEAALACGWRYGVVGGLRPHVVTTLGPPSAPPPPPDDPLGLPDALLAAISGGPLRVADLVAATCYPAGAPAVAIPPVWHPALALGPAGPFGDGALVWRGPTGGGR